MEGFVLVGRPERPARKNRAWQGTSLVVQDRIAGTFLPNNGPSRLAGVPLTRQSAGKVQHALVKLQHPERDLLQLDDSLPKRFTDLCAAQGWSAGVLALLGQGETYFNADADGANCPCFEWHPALGLRELSSSRSKAEKT